MIIGRITKISEAGDEGNRNRTKVEKGKEKLS